MAGILFGDKRFQTFLAGYYPSEWRIMNTGSDYERAAEIVRWKCQVKSRSEIKTSPEALANWRHLHGLYSAWRKTK
jgi:hypothetical protein